MDGIWEEAIEASILSLLHQDETVVEVGCNMGYHTLAMCEKIGRGGRLYGFEANPEVYRLLLLSLEYNDFNLQAITHNFAVSDHEGVAQLAYRPGQIGSGSIVAGVHRQFATDVVDVQTRKLDDVLDDVSDVAMLRMDAEGSEPLIVRGAERLISRSPNLKIVTEWSPGMMAGSVDVNAYVDGLDAMGFRAWRIDGKAQFTPLGIHELIDLRHCEIVLSRSDLNTPGKAPALAIAPSTPLQTKSDNMTENVTLPPERQDMKCKLCGSHATLVFGLPYNKKAGHPIPDEPDDSWYYQCDSCQFLFSDVIDYRDSHTGIYDETYWDNQDPDWYGRVTETFRLVALANELLNIRLDQAEILDFGCGIGGFVDMGRRSLNLNVWGTDIIPPKVGNEYFLPDLGDRKFDIITSCEVIEHLSHPREIFERIKSHLKPRGVFAFQTAQWDPEALGRDWWYLGPHNGHISLYSRDSLTHVFNDMGGKQRRLWNDYPGVQAWLFHSDG
jgi:FkbM family methyltransferase